MSRSRLLAVIGASPGPGWRLNGWMGEIVQKRARGMMSDREMESTSESLVMKARAGDRAAFSELVERYFGTVWAIAYARLREWQAAEDLTQGGFVLALLHINSLSDPRRFAGWLSRIAQHRAIDWIRSGNRSSRLVAMVTME